MRSLFFRLFLSLCAAVLLLFLFIPAHHKSIRANDSAAIGRLRQLGDAQSAYANRHPDKGFACSLTDLSFSNPWSGYEFHLGCDQVNGLVAKYRVTAKPLWIGQTGVRVYCMTEARVIWYDSATHDACLTGKRPVNLSE